MHELEAHYREEHEEPPTSKLKNNFLNFVDIAMTTLKIDKPTKTVQDTGAGRSSYERSGSRELDGASPQAVMEGHGTNVSEIVWEPQEIGQ